MSQEFARFGALSFGRENAEWELEEDPELLQTGFFDPFDIKRDILNLRKWLVIGPKGAGKTSILVNLQFESQNRYDLFVKSMNLEDFPLDSLVDIDTGESSGLMRSQDMWTYLLLIEILASLETDTGAPSNRDRDLDKLYASLRKSGLLPSRELRDSYLQFKEADIKAKPPGFEAGVKLERASHETPFRAALDHMLYQVSQFRTESTHLIFVDGLDTVAIGVNDNSRWTALTALVNSAHRLNVRMRDNLVRIRVVVLCRSDIYHELSDPAADKKKPNVATFNWLPDTRIPQDNYLVELAEVKCAVGANPRLPLLPNYFPGQVEFRGRTFEIADFLMRYTRYLPRDYLTLLNCIAKHSRTEAVVSRNTIKTGLNEYCTEYFVEEAWRGIFGLLPENESRRILAILKSVRGNSFEYDDLVQLIRNDDELGDHDLRKSLRALYRLGLISNLDRDDDGKGYLNYAYHSQFGRLDLNSRMVLHDALSIGLRKPVRRAAVS